MISLALISSRLCHGRTAQTITMRRVPRQTPSYEDRRYLAASLHCVQGHRHRKGRSRANGAFETNLAAHEHHELAANRQAEAGAAVFSRGGTVGLDEGLKEFC